MKKVIAAAVIFISTPAFGDTQSVTNAFALCQVIDGTGLASSPCEVSGWGSSVTATIDMNSSEARDLCSKISNYLKERNMHFNGGWTLQIKSPYSNGNNIAYCNLPQ